MKIEVWSDYVCPFCYIAKRKLEKALEDFSYKVTVEYKSYQLNPAARHIPDKSFFETISELEDIPLHQVKSMKDPLLEQAKAVGLDIDIERLQYTNTFDAHRLHQYAITKDLGNEAVERLLYAHFTELKLLSDRDTLLSLAMEIGLDQVEVEEVLATEKYARRVREDIDVAEQIGIQEVPFFVFNEKYALSGVQPVHVYRQVISKIWNEEDDNPAFQTSKNPKTTFCTGDDCTEC